MTGTRRAVVALAFGGLLLALAAPADAHSVGDFYPRRWTTARVTYDHTASVPSSWRPIIDQAAGRWNNVRDAELDFVRGDDVADYDWATCSGRTGMHRVSGGSGMGSPGGVLGVTTVCYSGSTITSANVAFDASESWYVGTDSPSSTQMDLLSVATHEVGHATGFAGHFEESSICPNNSDVQTMCAFYTRGTTWQRSLAKHDKHTMKNAY